VARIGSHLQGEFKTDIVFVLMSFFQAIIKFISNGVLLKEKGIPTSLKPQLKL